VADVIKALVPKASIYHVETLDALDRELQLLKGDMLIVKDVLQHLSNQNIQYFVNNILPNYKYALITNDYSTTMNNNADIVKGQHRTLDLAAPPFNLTNLQVEYKTLGSPKRVYIYTSANRFKSHLYTIQSFAICNNFSFRI